MPACADPSLTDAHNHFVVHIQSYDCRSTTRRQAENPTPSFIPGKMILPALTTRMKEWSDIRRQRIGSENCRTLIFIATATSPA